MINGDYMDLSSKVASEMSFDEQRVTILDIASYMVRVDGRWKVKGLGHLIMNFATSESFIMFSMNFHFTTFNGHSDLKIDFIHEVFLSEWITTVCGVKGCLTTAVYKATDLVQFCLRERSKAKFISLTEGFDLKGHRKFSFQGLRQLEVAVLCPFR